MTRLLKSGSIIAMLLTVSILAASAFAQSDNRRTTIAITYPLDQTIDVPFRGTTRLPRLKGDAKVRRQGRRGTRVTLSIDNMPRAYELGSVYTTFVLWAISPEGRVDNMGEIKRSGSMVVDSKIDVTTPLQTFALIVTAEPHYLVDKPNTIVSRNGIPKADSIRRIWQGSLGDSFLRDLPPVYDSGTAREIHQNGPKGAFFVLTGR